MAAFYTIAAVLLALVCSVLCAPPSKASPADPAAASPPSSSSSSNTPAASSPTADACIDSLLNTTDCLSFAQTGSKEKTPNKQCCKELSNLVDNNPVCLCVLLSQSNNYGLDLDVGRALLIPKICKIDTPPLSTCSDVGNPVIAPAEGPTTSISPPSSIALPPSLGTPSTISPSSSPLASSPIGSTLKNAGAKTKTREILLIIGMLFAAFAF